MNSVTAEMRSTQQERIEGAFAIGERLRFQGSR